jgi:hypothetical protein
LGAVSERPSPHSLGFRPTYRIPVSAEPEAVLERLRAAFDGGSRPLDARWAGEHVLVSLEPAERRIWSPWLTVSVRGPEPDAADEPSSMVVAQFCPHPQLWTALMLAFMGLGGAFLLAAGVAWAQLSMKSTPWAAGLAAAALLAALALWVASQVGQQLARAQMAELWAALEAALATQDPA